MALLRIAGNRWAEQTVTDLRKLMSISDRLGVPVIPMVAKRGEGLPELRKAILHGLAEPRRIPRICWPEFVDEARDSVRDGLAEMGVTVSDVVALRMVLRLT